MSLFTNKESVSLYQQNAFFAMKSCFHQMKRILKSRARCPPLSLLMASWTKVLYTIDTHLSFSVMPLHQHYFPTDDERIVRRRWGESWGEAEERVRKELLRGMGRWGERDKVERHVVESGTNKKESLEDFSSKLSNVKEGGDLLSRIALQYHRRRRA